MVGHVHPQSRRGLLRPKASINRKWSLCIYKVAMCPVIWINPWYLLNVNGMRQSKGAPGMSPYPPAQHTHTHIDTERWAVRRDLFCEGSHCNPETRADIHSESYLCVPGPLLGDGSMCGVSTEIPFRARCSQRTQHCFSYSANRRENVSLYRSQAGFLAQLHKLYELCGE